MLSPFSPRLPERAGDVVHWRRLHGSASTLATSQIDKPIIYVCAEAQRCQAAQAELSFYCPSETPIHLFPDWECLPYERISPHPDIVSERLLTLHKLPKMHRGVVIMPISALMQQLPPQSYTHAHTLQLSVNDDIDLDAFRQQLSDAGYYAVNQVMTAGEYAVRGGVIDVFPTGMQQPFRLDLFDTSIESIRLFDPETQRSTESLQQIRLLPAREFPLDEHSIKQFRQSFREFYDGDPRQAVIYKQISKGFAPTGSEFYLPLFFSETATLFDYLHDDFVFVFEPEALTNVEPLFEDAQQRYENAALDSEWPPLPPARLFLNQQTIYQQLKRFVRVELLDLELSAGKHSVEYNAQTPSTFNINPHQEAPYQALIDHIQTSPNRTLLVAESAGRRENLSGILKAGKLDFTLLSDWQSFLDSDVSCALITADIDRGLLLADRQLEVITEAQLYGQRTSQRQRRSSKNRDPDSIIKSLAELNIGDPVVHEDHGVGRYRGLTSLSLNDIDNEFMSIEYQGGDKIYIPILSLDRVSRYVGGNPDSAPLHKMGADTWLKHRSKAKEKAYDVAAEILDVQALRMTRAGHAFPQPDHSYECFAAGFLFTETPDQQAVIDDVINDMVNERPMDRLVCGDVGFGKTEIALRAAFMTIHGNKQVVMLVPTTLLAQQHYNNFADRFADWPVNIELFSRFRSAKETKLAVDGLKSGSVDIAIGTHKLLQNDISFKNLGLMIIDEEHRFGVRQKERLKQLRSEVDILTLTATPIPRTLNFALSGLRDISVIATPPNARLAVKTFVREWNNGVIKEAIVREIRRGGQVYFLHNEVQTIEKTLAELQQLVPQANIQIAHGQMRERQLESIMRDFYHQRFNVLLCTTIIESGIDVPTANTIIINKADRFGLAQLHQLRGRVGRSHHQAFAYLLTPPMDALTEDAKKRLSAIESLDTLGAGFALASQDLEIRGAGEILGETQSGMIDQIGYSLYSRYLDQAIASIKQKRAQKRGEVIPDAVDTDASEIDINLNIPARFADEYLPDVHLRLSMYKRISGARDHAELQELKAETIDRFGLLPESANNLFSLAELKLKARQFDIEQIELGPKGGQLRFAENPDINFEKLMLSIANSPQHYKLKNANTLQITQDIDTPDSRFECLETLFAILQHD